LSHGSVDFGAFLAIAHDRQNILSTNHLYFSYAYKNKKNHRENLVVFKFLLGVFFLRKA